MKNFKILLKGRAYKYFPWFFVADVVLVAAIVLAINIFIRVVISSIIFK